MGLKPTNDPLAVMRRAEAVAKRDMRNAQDAGGTEPFQVVRKLQAQILELETVVEQVVELFNRMPQNDGRQVDEAGWAIDTPPIGGAWETVATALIPKPATTNRAAVMAVATAAATADTDPGGNFAMHGRILISGVASQEREGTLEALVNTTRSSINLGFFHELSGLGSEVTVELQLRGRYNDFPASNVASLSVSVGFTKVG